MRVSIVIPCHNRADDTAACLASLDCQTDTPEIEILVVDNGCTDGTRDLALPGRHSRIITAGRNLGFAGGVNLGLRHATGDWLMVLNNDTLAPPNLVQRLLTPLLADQTIGITAPTSNHVKGEGRLEINASFSARQYGQIAEELARFAAGKVQDVDTLSGLCMVFSRAVLDAIGRWDETFGLGNFEDNDFSFRARLRGYRLCLVRDAYLHHRGHSTFRDLGVDYRACLRQKEQAFRDKWSTDIAGQALIAHLDGDIEGAGDLARSALAAYPNWIDAHNLMARQAALRGDLEQAIESCRTYLRGCPQSTVTWLGLAELLLQTGAAEDATEPCWNALARHCYLTESQTGTLHYLLAWWRLQGGHDRIAEDLLERGLKDDPDDVRLHSLLGRLLFDTGRLEHAAGSFRNAHRLGDRVALVNLARCQQRAGMISEALATLAQALVENPRDQVCRRETGAVLTALESAGADTTELRRAFGSLLATTEQQVGQKSVEVVTG